MRKIGFLAAVGILAGCDLLPKSESAKAQELVARTFVDPASAQFRDVKSHVNRIGIEAVCGEVNGRNRFGGYAGFRKFYVSGGSAFLEPEAGLSIDPISGMEDDLAEMKYTLQYNKACVH